MWHRCACMFVFACVYACALFVFMHDAHKFVSISVGVLTGPHVYSCMHVLHAHGCTVHMKLFHVCLCRLMHVHICHCVQAVSFCVCVGGVHVSRACSGLKSRIDRFGKRGLLLSNSSCSRSMRRGGRWQPRSWSMGRGASSSGPKGIPACLYPRKWPLELGRGAAAGAQVYMCLCVSYVCTNF